jgi:hypothetical protein
VARGHAARLGALLAGRAVRPDGVAPADDRRRGVGRRRAGGAGGGREREDDQPSSGAAPKATEKRWHQTTTLRHRDRSVPAERSFQVLYQVAGRAGRAHKEGVVVFQTHCPENYAVQTAARCDYEGFVQQELQFRKSAGYPPFTRLIRILVEGSRLPRVHDVARDIRTDLEGIADLEALGPAPAVIAIVKNRHRLHCLAKCRTDASFRVAMERLNGVHGRGSSSLRIMVDVDPASLL